jgi:hypothetical protein
MQLFVRAALVAALLAFATYASATSARRLSNQDMVQEAEVIAIGTAIDVQTVWEERTLMTLVTLKVNESLKGATDSTVTIALPGGIDANRPFPVAMTYAGAPQIGVGEEVFVLLRRDDDVQSGLVVVGFSQGKFSIMSDTRGRKVVEQDLTAILLDSGAGIVPGSRSLTSLDELRAEISGYLR